MGSFATKVILLTVCCIILCDAQVTLQLCDAPIKDEICVLECHTPDLSQSVVFKKDNTEYASCKFILGTLSCTSIYPTRSLISQQSSPAAVTFLNITQLSRAGDQGSWTCDYGSSGSSAQTLTVLTAPTQRIISGNVNIDYCTGDKSDTRNVTLMVTCSSAIKVTAVLSSPTTGVIHAEPLRVTKYPLSCSDVADSIYTTVFTITSTTGGLKGKDYFLTFKTQLSAGVGKVYRDTFPGYISFSCESSKNQGGMMWRLELVNKLVVPCLSMLLTSGYHDDMCAAKEMCEKWCAFLGQEIGEKTGGPQDFLSKLFESPSENKVDHIPIDTVKDLEKLYNNYQEIMNIAYREVICIHCIYIDKAADNK